MHEDEELLETEKTSNVNMKKQILSLHFIQTVFPVVVRSTDTDVLILLGLAGRSEGINIMDLGNHRIYIGVSKLAATLEEKLPGMTEALIGLHIMFLQERKGEALSAVGGRSGTYHGTAIPHH